MEEIRAGGETFVTNALIRRTFALRACVLNYQTTEEDVAALALQFRASWCWPIVDFAP